MENIEKNIESLEKKYNLIIPKEYIEFVKKIDMFEFSWKIVKVENTEFELNHFLGYNKDVSSQDLYDWYLLAESVREDYLTVAMGFGNEEIAIKVKGNNLGEIVLIEQNEDDEIIIKKICNNFNQFEKILKEGEN